MQKRPICVFDVRACVCVFMVIKQSKSKKEALCCVIMLYLFRFVYNVFFSVIHIVIFCTQFALCQTILINECCISQDRRADLIKMIMECVYTLTRCCFPYFHGLVRRTTKHITFTVLNMLHYRKHLSLIHI